MGQDDLLADAYRRGFDHAHGIACHNVPTIGARIDKSVDRHGLGDWVTAENIRDYHQLLCYAADENTRSTRRSSSPRVNSTHRNMPRDPEAFDAGVSDSITADLLTYTDADYGIDEFEHAWACRVI